MTEQKPDEDGVATGCTSDDDPRCCGPSNVPHRFGTGDVSAADRDKISEHVLTAVLGVRRLSYHEYNRLWSAGVIDTCTGCTAAAPGDVVYHPHARLCSLPDQGDSIVFDLLKAALQ